MYLLDSTILQKAIHITSYAGDERYVEVRAGHIVYN